MPFSPYYIIAAFDIYEEITRYRTDCGGWTYNPIKAKQYFIEEDCKLAMSLMDKVKGHHYFTMNVCDEYIYA